MDEVTQQNSALVEENAATAKTLEEQQAAMSERVGYFRVGESRVAEKATPISRPARQPLVRPAKTNGAGHKARTPMARGNLAMQVDPSADFQEF